ncbi:GntR family transcriptional regulator [Actinomyces qiguomingii]|uniref:GntR family transcriptional regulator n=1 Tax=Actinomyces qiguomingii TaxID=2057800 RepID=UPI000CA0552F|nr:GntR family transcriptional regulator [Actinomyces qiguomingii]
MTALLGQQPAEQRRRGKWLRVRDAIIEEFTQAEPDSPLPSEMQLCERYGVSRITVRRALDELERADIIYRKQGKGTFIKGAPTPARPLDRYDLSGFFTQRTSEGRRVSSLVLRQEIISAPRVVTLNLMVAPGKEVIRIDRLRSVDGTIDHLTRAWLLASRFEGLTEADLTNRSLYELIAAKYGVSLREDHVEVTLSRPSADDAQHLGCATGELRLHTTSVAFDDAHRPTIYAETTFASTDAVIGFTTRAESR